MGKKPEFPQLLWPSRKGRGKARAANWWGRSATPTLYTSPSPKTTWLRLRCNEECKEKRMGLIPSSVGEIFHFDQHKETHEEL